MRNRKCADFIHRTRKVFPRFNCFSCFPKNLHSRCSPGFLVKTFHARNCLETSFLALILLLTKNPIESCIPHLHVRKWFYCLLLFLPVAMVTSLCTVSFSLVLVREMRACSAAGQHSCFFRLIFVITCE